MTQFHSLHHVDQKTIDQMFETYSPVFVLSTGRCGSKYIADLFKNTEDVVSFHEPEPNLMYFSNYAFQNQKKIEVLEKIFLAARLELIIREYIKGKIYFESNQCLTFFAPVIAKIFKKAKFIHLIRHPGDFVRSGIRKGWHSNDSIWESGRIKMANMEEWEKLISIEKLSWVWNSTNLFIEGFRESVDSKSNINLKLEEISGENKKKAYGLFQFVGVTENVHKILRDLSFKKINTLYIGVDEPSNMKKVKEYPIYNKWDKPDKDCLKRIVSELSVKYNYDL